MSGARTPLLLVLLACSRPPAMGPPPGPAPPPAPAPIEVTAVPGAGYPRVVERGARGALKVVSGAWRAEVAPSGEVRWSEDAMPRGIVAAWPVGRGWAFVSADGVVARSREFLARLERVGELPLGLNTLEGNDDVPWIVAGGRIWSLVGDGAPTPLDPQPPGDSLAVVMLDKQTGIVLLDGGGLARTGDAGRSWSRLDVGLRAAHDLHRGKKGALAYSIRESLAISREGVLSPSSEVFEYPKTPSPPPDEREHDRFDVALLGVGRYRGPGGTILIGATKTLAAVDPATGRVVREVGAALPGDSCYLSDWGTTIEAHCDDTTYRLTPAWTFERLFKTAGSHWSLHFSDDGKHLVSVGRSCPSMTKPPEEGGVAWSSVVCSFDPIARTWRQLPVDGSDARFGDTMHGDRIAMVRKDQLVLIHVDSGKVLTEPLEPRPDARWVLQRWVPSDGTLVLQDRLRDGPRKVAVRAPDGTMTYSELPAEIQPMFGPDLYFFDARRGLAVGMSYFDYAVTSDGGRHWERIAGKDPWLDAMTRPVYSMGDGTIHAICTDDGCAAQGLFFRAGGRPLFSRERIVAPVLTPPPVTADPEQAAINFDCQPLPAPAGGEASFENDVASGTLITDTTARKAEVRWTTSRGERGGTGPVALDHDLTGRARFVPLFASADLLLLARCELKTYEDCRLLRAARRRLELKYTLDEVGPSGLWDHDVAGALYLPDGGSLVHLRSESASNGDTDWLLSFGPNGAVSGRRSFAWAPRSDRGRRLRALVLQAGRVGLAVESVDDTTRWRFLPWDGSAAGDLPPVRLSDAGPCAAATAGATEIHIATGQLLTLPGAESNFGNEVTFEVTPERTCWRRLRVPIPPGVARIDAGAEPMWVNGSHRNPLTCLPKPPAAR